MDPQLEFFLEDAFRGVRPTSPAVGRVVVEPDYDTSPNPEDRDRLASDLVRCIEGLSVNETELAAPAGFSIEIGDAYPVLAKYVRRITLHQTPPEQPWVEIAPPGNWI